MKVQSQKIKQLSVLLEKHQRALEKVQAKQGPVLMEMPLPNN